MRHWMLCLLSLAACQTLTPGPQGTQDTCMRSDDCTAGGGCPESTDYILPSGNWESIDAANLQGFGLVDGAVRATVDLDASTVTLSWARPDGTPLQVVYGIDEVGWAVEAW